MSAAEQVNALHLVYPSIVKRPDVLLHIHFPPYHITLDPKDNVAVRKCEEAMNLLAQPVWDDIKTKIRLDRKLGVNVTHELYGESLRRIIDAFAEA